MIKLFSDKKRWAVVKPTGAGGLEISISRSRGDGSTVGVKFSGHYGKWRTFDTEELLIALAHVTHTEAQLQELRDNGK